VGDGTWLVLFQHHLLDPATVEHAMNAVGGEQQEFTSGQRLLDNVKLGPAFCADDVCERVRSPSP